MPPKASSAGQSSQIVPIGRKEVFSKTNPARQHGKRDENGLRPTTSKALILRNGKYGARGTGELIQLGKIRGREKLDLLAENLVEEYKKAVLSPLRLETCSNIAESQADLFIDDIVKLRDPDSFQHLVEIELQARNDPNRSQVTRTPSHVAKLVATRIHNSYMLASAWKMVSVSLKALSRDGLMDQNVKQKLKNVPELRERYLILCDVVDDLIKVNQNKFSVLATTAPHYAKYFKLKQTESQDPTEPEYIFDWKDLKLAANSFLDSIIIELCFPQGIYPKAVLYQILHDAVDEAPREARRFPQALWDAVGDLSIAVELQELLSAPLFGAEGEAWRKERRQMPEEYECWVDAQIFSEKASNMFANFKETIFPLEKTRKKRILDQLWREIDENYVNASGLSIDALWHLEDAFVFTPQWTAIAPANAGNNSKDSYENAPGLKKKSIKQGKFLAITDRGLNDDSDGSMPGLQSVSNSEDEDEDEDDDDDDFTDPVWEPDDFGSSSDEADYDSEEEEEIRDQLRRAMDTAHEANWSDPDFDMPDEINPFNAEEEKGNAFLKLLGSLRGRMFSASPTLKTGTRMTARSATARGAFRATPTGVPKSVPTTKPRKPEPQPERTTSNSPAPEPKSYKATVEDIEDEDDVKPTSIKKKKKKTKKKKSAAPSGTHTSSPSLDSLASTMKGASTSSVPASLNSTIKGSGQVPSFMSSTLSLGVGEAETAQSARSYLQKENLIKTDKKIKTRPDHSTIFSSAEEKISSAAKPVVTGKEDEKLKEVDASTWFNRLGKKTTGFLKQLLRTKEERKKGITEMKWENFVKVMVEMGFSYDPSTAGSSVRFDPPSKHDRSISIHKPHPGSTIKQYKLLDISDKLKKFYGWKEEDLAKLDDDRFDEKN